MALFYVFTLMPMPLFIDVAIPMPPLSTYQDARHVDIYYLCYALRAPLSRRYARRCHADYVDVARLMIIIDDVFTPFRHVIYACLRLFARHDYFHHYFVDVFIIPRRHAALLHLPSIFAARRRFHFRRDYFCAVRCAADDEAAALQEKDARVRW